CGMCVKVCPHEVFELAGKKAHIIRRDYCMECGACALNCPVQAITVNSGVGCAAGIISGILNNTEPTCGCSDSNTTCC
ncbi:MAG: mercury methylation ferredoxin HgcB, partial [Bacteroidales bacterium]|nr:mercury methylation ferredoxin HgcB [Bacteroidales bacterium]